MSVFNTLKAFMKPADILQLENAMTIGKEYLIESLKLLRENNKMLRSICEKEGIKTNDNL